MLRVHLFGFPRCERDQENIPIPRRKTAALLAYLLVTAQPHSRDALAALFWPEDDQSHARANIRKDLSRLKSGLGDNLLLVDREQVRLNPAAELWLDVAEFRICIEKVRQAGAETGDSVRVLTAAVDLYHADFLAGFSLPDSPAFDEWQFFQNEDLRNMLAYALQRLIALHSQAGEFGPAVEYARRWVSLDPLHEPGQRKLIELYALSGQQTAALRQYQEVVRLLQAELGVAPEDATTKLYQAIRKRQFATPDALQKSPVQRPETLPGQPRDQELALAERYLAEELLAVGGNGELYRGHDRKSGRPVVIKRIRPELITQDQNTVERFLLEGEALRQLNHPNIVAFLDTFTHLGQHNLVMEYVPGGSLRDQLERQPKLPLERVLDIALELADALSRAHHLNILHRDLKPDNVLLASDGTPRLSDFGLARLIRKDVHMTQPGTILGSPGYMSPEALRGEELDPRSDIWSFGVLLYEMLAGRLPFEGEELTPILISILQDPLPEISRFRPDIPAPLAGLIERILVKDPANRIASMRQVAAELEALRTGRPLAFPQPQPVTSFPVITPAYGKPYKVHSLPTQAAIFIGRENELEKLSELLVNPEVRLVTIAGFGGIGKTRLATAAAQHIVQTHPALFPNGAVWVPLGGVASVDDIPAALARALQIPLAGRVDPLREVSNYLQDKQILIVLDNFEHLLDGALILNQVLETAPGVKLLMTSREPLRLVSEWRLDLEGLRYPKEQPADLGETSFENAGDYEAVQLFVRNAQQVKRDFELTAENAPYVIRICQIVAGAPLAIHLAAMWLRVMSPEQVVAELSRNLDLLTSSLRDIPERQRSIRAIFDSTWNMLSPDEQKAFLAISVFNGGFTEAAAAQIANITPYLLTGMVDRGLVQYSNKGRYEIHELTRQFAEEKRIAAGLGAEIEQRHSDYYLNLIAQQETELQRETAAEALHHFLLEIANIRQAWRRAVLHNRLDLIESTLPALAAFYEFSGLFKEGERVFQQAAQQLADQGLDEITTPLLLQLQMKYHYFLLCLGITHNIEASLEQVYKQTQASQNELLFAEALSLHGLSAYYLNKTGPAAADFQQAIALYQAHDRPRELASMLNYLGEVRSRDMKAEEAQSYHQRALEIGKQLDSTRVQALSLSHLGVTEFYRDDYHQALTHWEQAVSLFEILQDQRGLGRTLNNLGYVRNYLGDHEQALRDAKRAIPLLHQIGIYIDEANAYDTMGENYLALGLFIQAKECFQNALGFAQQIELLAMERAYYQINLAIANIELGHYAEAEDLLHQIFDLLEGTNNQKVIARVYVALGKLYSHTGQHAQALENYDRAIDRFHKAGESKEIAPFLVEKGFIFLARGEIQQGYEFAAEGLRIAEEIHRLPVILRARLLIALLDHAGGRAQAAIGQLRQLLQIANIPFVQAAIHYELWRIIQAPEHGQRALSLYRKLNERSSGVLYQTRLQILEISLSEKSPVDPHPNE